MDEKGAWIACPVEEEVVVLISINEMYVSAPKNCLSLTDIESISADGKAIPPLVIVPSIHIVVSWYDSR